MRSHRKSKKRSACDREGNVKKMRQSELKKLSKFLQEPDNLDLIKDYCDAGNGLNALYKSTTPLCAASRGGSCEVVQYLISFGADPNMRDTDLATPLYIAASHGHDDIVELLLNRGADPDIRNTYGCSALVSAVTNGMFRSTQMLIDAGASVNVQRPNTFGVDVSILSYVLFIKGDWVLAKQLLEAGTLPHVFMPPLDFILLEDPQMPVSFIQTLLDAGFDLYCEGWVRQMTRTVDEMTDRQGQLLQLLTHRRKHPPSLQYVCRITIRVTIARQLVPRMHFRDKINSLPLPKRVKQFLALEEG